MQLYQRPGSPFWWVSATVNGQRHRISTRQKGKREARLAADRIVAALRASAPAQRGGIWTVSQAVGAWWDDHASTTRSAAAIWSNVENLDRCLDCTLPLDRLTAAHLMDFRARRRGEGVRGPTINRDMAYLHAALNHAADVHAQPRPRIAWARLKYPESEWRKRFVSRDEYAALLAHAAPSLRPIIVAAVATGLRRANLFALAWHQVDLDGRTITVPTSKGRRASIKRIAGPLAAELETLRAAILADDRIPAGPVFDTTNFRRRWAAAVKGAGLADFRFHDLRHSFATWARKGGVDLAELKEAMDHSSIAMTARYAHVTPDEMLSTFDRASAAFCHTDGHSDDQKGAKSNA